MRGQSGWRLQAPVGLAHHIATQRFIMKKFSGVAIILCGLLHFPLQTQSNCCDFKT